MSPRVSSEHSEGRSVSQLRHFSLVLEQCRFSANKSFVLSHTEVSKVPFCGTCLSVHWETMKNQVHQYILFRCAQPDWHEFRPTFTFSLLTDVYQNKIDFMCSILNSHHCNLTIKLTGKKKGIWLWSTYNNNLRGFS